MRASLLLLLFIFGIVLPATAEPRVALVVGNSNYGPDVGRLPNPANDAELMAKTLKQLGFKVIKLVDADQNTMKRAIADFGTALTSSGPDAVGLFFYAGHGMQVAGTNYLIPLRARIDKEADVDLEAVKAEAVLQQMEFAGNRINIVILDACRNNPLARSMRSATRGLAEIKERPTGTFIAYSTAPGQVAADGTGRNSPYTEALAKQMLKPGIALEETFRDVRVKVLAETKEEQVPWESSSLTGAFYFVPPSPGGTIAQPSAPDVPAPSVAKPTAPAVTTPTVTTPTAAAVEPPAKPLPAGIKAGQATKDCADCPEMIIVPPGKFMMGAPKTEAGRTDAEGPQTKVSIGPFAIGKYPVTRGEFAAFINDSQYQSAQRCWVEVSIGKYDFKDGADWQNPGYPQTDDDPVVCVSWDDAKHYVKWLATKTGKDFRLPSEAELEYATRGGTTTSRYWGDDGDDFCSYGNTADDAAKKKHRSWQVADCDDGKVYTAPVGSYKPNAFGLYDMLGNVKVWAADCWNGNLDKVDVNGAPTLSGDCSLHAVRGSAWDAYPSNARSAFREKNYATSAFLNYGFRVARGL
jgi:formylglycine-generating enzyme required for sulfatase activity